jgi:hypothetical protein
MSFDQFQFSAVDTMQRPYPMIFDIFRTVSRRASSSMSLIASWSLYMAIVPKGLPGTPLLLPNNREESILGENLPAVLRARERYKVLCMVQE